MSDQPINQPAQAPTPDPASPAPGPIPYDRFKEVNDQLRTATARLAQIEADQKKASEARLKEDGKLQELLAAREQELAALRSQQQRTSVALRKGLTGDLADLADRLRGANETELEADADRLLALLKPKSDPTQLAPLGMPPATGQPQRLDISKMTPAQIREARAKGLLK